MVSNTLNIENYSFMTNEISIKIAIDGPSASGKSSAAQKLAEKLNFVRIEGCMFYRAITYETLKKYKKAVDESVDGFQQFISEMNISVKKEKIFCNDEEITPYIRTPEIDSNVGKIAKIPLVRKKVFEMERNAINSIKEGLIMDGRVIGTVVMPDADFKFFITASSQTRAHRRHLQQPDADFNKVLDEIEKRDKEDASRKIDPLIMAKDAILIENDKLTLNETVEVMENYIKTNKNGLKF